TESESEYSSCGEGLTSIPTIVVRNTSEGEAKRFNTNTQNIYKDIILDVFLSFIQKRVNDYRYRNGWTTDHEILYCL
ncbi:unnamed protein product, partial [Medioppia subpectinata]